MLSARCLCLLLAMCLNVVLAQDGYETFPTVPQSRFKLYVDNVTWAEAVTACQQDGELAHLVVINSVHEGAVISQLVDRIYPQYVWVGINDIEEEGTWVTIEGELVSESGYNNWYGPNPDNDGGNENCGTAYWDAEYNDVRCTYLIPYICEIPNA